MIYLATIITIRKDKIYREQKTTHYYQGQGGERVTGKGSFADDRNDLYLYWGVGYMVYLFSSYYAFKVCAPHLRKCILK